ncbi:flagellar biosynthetic protein FliR [Methylotenera sp.]|uniref:flagellar biosynthetic protein FliR n=1 Tax=Methylotenera sp. TaxID=2051956 RepID=UPI002722F59A|nr:flagellar biosynthetic protein FliR [Methylotenera sp.]MDO9204351.1 flagellar biosynthetic protein FliR [Methylotenera sp.]MDP2071343.1 flagellar biosynthetic protein FliR [Methylotenera sp.]MDP2229808.1 flagellar biosynthetic protein FliR [Methylotenera sp.]MDP3006367.1 flagellar biosynthetic protein FliR [Methylotenera sp.]MDP3140427.1 flagellar biosynthetic protein FliR [Methylotenera sp.]
MVSISSDLLQTWIISLLWPLTRILGVIAAAPIFSHKSIPQRVKLGLGIMLTLIIVPTLPPLPQFEIFSFQGLLILVQQLIIGLAIGFSMRLVFAAVDLAGQLIGMSMGIGFASFFDPQTRGQSTALNQFLVILAMLIFLSLDGHLLIVTAVANSFITMPIALGGSGIDPMKIAMWGETIFSVGLLLALPAVAALLITNMALGILTKTAPQLNMFGIGFPITLSIGFLVLALSLPGMLKPIENFIEKGASNMAQVAVPNSAVPNSTLPVSESAASGK